MAEDVVGDLVGEPLAVVARERRSPPRAAAGCRRRRARAARSGSIVTLKSCGPSSPITARWTRFLSSANGSRAPCGRAGRAVARRSWSSISSSSRRDAGVRELVRCSVVRADGCRSSLPVERGELSERCGGLRLGPRRATIGTPSLTARGISRSLGTRTSGSRPSTRDDVAVGDADPAVGPVEDERDHAPARSPSARASRARASCS